MGTFSLMHPRADLTKLESSNRATAPRKKLKPIVASSIATLAILVDEASKVVSIDIQGSTSRTKSAAPATTKNYHFLFTATIEAHQPRSLLLEA